MRALLALSRYLLASGLLFLSGSALRLRAEAAAQPVEIEIPFLAQAYGTAFFEHAARAFERERPDVRVHMDGDVRLHEKVRVRVMAGDLPDATDAVLLYQNLIAAGKIVDLTAALDGPNWECDARWRDTFLPGVLERWTVNGRTYGVPFAYAVWGLFYNKALFAAHGWTAPRTWDEFYVLCDKIRASGVAPLSLPGVYMRYADAFLRSAFYDLAGPARFRAYNELAPGTRSDPRFVCAADVAQRITTHYLIDGWEGMTHTAAEQAFLDGQAAMTLSASWLVSETAGKGPPDFSLGMMNFPVFADGIASANTLQAQSAYYFLFAKGDSRKERATIDFFRFLTSRARVRAFARELDAAAAARGASPADFSPRMHDVAALIARADDSFDAGQPTSPAFLALINDSMNGLRQQLLTGQITPQTFAEQLEHDAAAQRERQENPNRVQFKHAGKASLLLAVLLLAIAWLAWANWRDRRRSGLSPRASDRDEVGPLRPTVAGSFVGPALALFLAFVIGPGVASFIWACARWDGFASREWVGWLNFKWLLFESDAFWYALKNNLYLMIVPTLVVVPVSLALAGLIHRGVWGATLFRVVFLFPNLLGGIAATLLWMNAYDPHGGLVNVALVKLGTLLGSEWLRSFADYAWLSQTHLYRALIPIYVWMACGFNVVLYLAAMEGIDAELYEAAEIDGASRLRQFFTLTIPMIWDVLTISAVFIVIAGLNTFEMVWLLTSQDPQARSHVLSTLMVSTMFKEFDIGRATAVAVVMFLLVLVGSGALMRVLRARNPARA